MSTHTRGYMPPRHPERVRRVDDVRDNAVIGEEQFGQGRALEQLDHTLLFVKEVAVQFLVSPTELRSVLAQEFPTRPRLDASQTTSGPSAAAPACSRARRDGDRTRPH